MHAEDLFEKVTAELVAAIEAGAGGWQMPWRRLGAVGVPRSIDGRPYRGWNALVLGMTAADRGWSNVWGTYRSWQRHGGQVRRGEHGTQVVLWKPTERPDRSEPDAETARTRRSLLARAFTVFAAEQVDGARAVDLSPAPPMTAGAAAGYFAAIGARVVRGGDVACYVPGSDTIHLPSAEQFSHPDHAASTECHEHIHWTGHPSRLARDLSGRFGDQAYGAEELVAELGSAFWSAQVGLEQAVRDDHARYLGDWLAMLRADSRALVAACGHAQRALDYLNTAAGLAAAAEPLEEAS